MRNFSFTLVDGNLYYRENSRMNPVGNDRLLPDGALGEHIRLADEVSIAVQHLQGG